MSADRDLRLECLKLAIEKTSDIASTLRAANAFSRFVAGEPITAILQRDAFPEGSQDGPRDD